MAKFRKLETIGKIRSTGIVPVYYNSDFQMCKDTVKACYDGGIRVFEFTSRGETASALFPMLVQFVRKECPEMAIGAGTVMDAPSAAMFIQNGADFIVSPYLGEEIAVLCNRRGIPYSPGCGTVTEIVRALELGCDLVKVFPAGTVGGPAFVKNVLAPLPWVMLMATGAVEPTRENLSAWAASGVTAVGMGSRLFAGEPSPEELSGRCAKCIEWLKQ